MFWLKLNYTASNFGLPRWNFSFAELAIFIRVGKLMANFFFLLPIKIPVVSKNLWALLIPPVYE